MVFSTSEGELFAKAYQPVGGNPFFRIDIFGNDSFILVSPPDNFMIPDWVLNKTPGSRWGI
jgi:hypothetical protein